MENQTTSSAHTAGPWHLGDIRSSIVATLPSGKEVQVTGMFPSQFTGSSITEETKAFREQTDANARLIAAAPTLLLNVQAAVVTYQDRLALLEDEREWRPDDE